MSKSLNITKEYLVEEYLNKKKSAITIGERLKCSSTTIYKYLGKHNIKRRSISEAQGWQKGDGNPNFKHGNKTQKWFNCIECGHPITSGSSSGLCKSCSCKGERSYFYGKKGKLSIRYKEKPIYYCIDGCGKIVTGENRRCEECYYIFIKIPSNNNNWKGGQIKIICPICDKEFFVKQHRLKNKGKNLFCSTECLYKWQSIIRSGVKNKKHSEFMKELWLNEEYRDKIIQNTVKSLNFKQNNSEKLLEKTISSIVPNEYKYVGDGKMFIGRFVPDFINCNGKKKIIELYGDYWHRNTQKRDKERLKTYNEYGYKTLVIWEHELKNLDILKDKIIEFNKI